MTLIYEILLFSSVKIRANFDALHYGNGFQPPLASMLDTYWVGSVTGTSTLHSTSSSSFSLLRCRRATGTRLGTWTHGGMFSSIMIWYFPGRAPNPLNTSVNSSCKVVEGESTWIARTSQLCRLTKLRQRLCLSKKTGGHVTSAFGTPWRKLNIVLTPFFLSSFENHHPHNAISSKYAAGPCAILLQHQLIIHRNQSGDQNNMS